MGVPESGHRFERLAASPLEGRSQVADARFKNRKNRGLLEPGGLNVERVRALPSGDACRISPTSACGSVGLFV